jgi:hypothetical protein
VESDFGALSARDVGQKSRRFVLVKNITSRDSLQGQPGRASGWFGIHRSTAGLPQKHRNTEILLIKRCGGFERIKASAQIDPPNRFIKNLCVSVFLWQSRGMSPRA